MDHRGYDRLILNGELMEVTHVIRKCKVSPELNKQQLGIFLEEWMKPNPKMTIQTSGSTGTPKNILVEKQQMLASAALTARFFDFKLNQTALLCLPINYIAGKMMVVRALLSGLNLVTIEPCRNPLHYLPKDIVIDFAPLTPMQLQHIENAEKVKIILLGGAPVAADLEARIKSIPTMVFQSYGMTETLSHVALRKLNGDGASNLYQALPEVNFLQDERKCLIINLPFLNHPVVTNDIVELYGAHAFLWKGRADNVINSGGIKLFPEEIEKKISGFMQNRFFVFGVPDNLLGQKLVLFIEGKKIGQDELLLLEKSMADTLGRYEQPKEIVFIPYFKTTQSGKIQRKQTVDAFKLK